MLCVHVAMTVRTCVCALACIFYLSLIPVVLGNPAGYAYSPTVFGSVSPLPCTQEQEAQVWPNSRNVNNKQEVMYRYKPTKPRWWSGESTEYVTRPCTVQGSTSHTLCIPWMCYGLTVTLTFINLQGRLHNPKWKFMIITFFTQHFTQPHAPTHIYSLLPYSAYIVIWFHL